MPTYLYQDESGGEHEVTQSIKENAYTWRDSQTGEWGHGPTDKPNALTVKRLIAGAPGFSLVAGASGGWASTGYSQPEHARKAEAVLGRKLYKPGGQ